MVVSIKDALKFVGIIIVAFCAVFVCTFLLNFYLDALKIEYLITEDNQPLYDAQLSTAKFASALSGSCLTLIALIMLLFYIKLYIDNNMKKLGILKAMGYSNGKIALKFLIFGISVFIGAAFGFGMGFAVMPFIYKALIVDGLPEISITFHVGLLFALVVAPTVIFSLLSCGYAYLSLRRPVSCMIRDESCGKIKNRAKVSGKERRERSFLVEMAFKTLGSKKPLAFFVAAACFCFSAMMQMGWSMEELSSGAMGVIIVTIGVVLAVVLLFMALTSLMKSNVKNIAIMKAFGYGIKQCAMAVLLCYVPFALLGFAVGTAYQFGILTLMVNLVSKDVEFLPEYNFNVSVFFITLAVFVVLYSAITLFYSLRISKISVKEVMTEN